MSYITFFNQDQFRETELSFKYGVNVDQIPKDLIENGKWCCYKVNKSENNHFSKVPFRPVVGMPANPRDETTFSSFDEAYEDYCFELNGYHGIGVLLTGGLCLIDIDECYLDGQLSPRAKRIIDHFGSYAEVSASGMGIHILFKVDESFKLNTGCYYLKNPFSKIEVYMSGTGRYSTVTGRRLEGTSKNIEDGTGKIKGFMDEFMLKNKKFKQKPRKKINKNIISKVQEISDDILLGKIRSSRAGDKFIDLYDLGAWEGRYNSQSEADMELAGILAFFCAGDYERIEKFMLQSQLGREKWDKNKNYLSNTIKKAISNCHNFYNPR